MGPTDEAPEEGGHLLEVVDSRAGDAGIEQERAARRWGQVPYAMTVRRRTADVRVEQ